MGDSVQSLREGSQFGRYYLKRLLGNGAMGDVYEAEDTSTQRTVALKVLPPVFSHDLVFCARLQRQARVVSRLQEPHIVPIHDYGEIDGQQFVDMQLIEGTDLASLIGQLGALPAPRAVAIAFQVASALDAAHAIGVVHGDIKPENVRITSDDFVYLCDLGITDVLPRKGVAGVAGSEVRTWKYTAPERFTAPAVNHKVDVYALACVLHECLTGYPPYWADSVGALISAHLMEPAPQPSQLRSAVSAAFDEVIARGLAKDPERRYSSAGELARAAYEALSAPDQDRAADILRSSREAAGSNAEFELPSAANAPCTPSTPTSHPSAQGPDPESNGWPSPPDPSSPNGSTRTPGSVPGFGPDVGGWPGQFGTAAPGPRPPWAMPRRPTRWRVLVAAATLLALIVLGGAAIWLLGPSRSTPPIAGTHASTTAPSSPDSSAAEAQTRLFGLLPHGYPPGTCKPIAAPRDALAAASCDQNADPDGPLSATYALFPDGASLRSAFDRIVQASSVIDCPGRIQSPGPWHRNATPDKASGMLACATQQGNPVVGWTDDSELLLSVVTAQPPRSTIDQLYGWWTSHS